MMIRRVPIETKINHERWLVSYADFITLLFAFFVVMYSISQVNEEKYKVLSTTLESAFSASDGSSNETESADSVSDSSQADLADLTQALQGLLGGLIEDGQVNVVGNEEWVELELRANVLFASGKAELTGDANAILNSVADVLAPYSNAVSIAGHTDDRPINTARFSNNWELSSARAVSVVNTLAYGGVKPERLSAVGYGEYRPIADNSSEQGRNRNRRVILRVSRGAVPDSRIEVNEIEGGLELDPEVVSTSTREPQVRLDESPSDSDDNEDFKSLVKPVRLEGGGLLFSSDPEIPRSNPPVSVPKVAPDEQASSQESRGTNGG